MEANIDSDGRVEINPQCYLCHCGLDGMSVHSFRRRVIQHNELLAEGHT